MATPSNGCCSQIMYSHNTIEVSRKDITLLILATALVVIGSLWVAGIFSTGGNMGVILPFVNFGAAIEGGTCIALGAATIAIIFGRIFSPRSVCSDSN
jgi:hypothetical protein